MTEGDKMLVRSINRALVMHPFVDPLPVVIGGGIVKLSRPTARSLATRLEQMEREQREIRARRTALTLVPLTVQARDEVLMGE